MEGSIPDADKKTMAAGRRTAVINNMIAASVVAHITVVNMILQANYY